jgi:hypothetical protein
MNRLRRPKALRAEPWIWGYFRIGRSDPAMRRYGCGWRSWGIHNAGRKRYIVTHRPSGKRLTEFDDLRCARRFCEAIDELTDWSVEHLDPSIGLAIHREALRITGRRPQLQLLPGGAP